MQMFGVTGAGLAAVKTLQNGGKSPRHSVDTWDKVRTHLDLSPQLPHKLTARLAAKYGLPPEETVTTQL